MSGVPTDSPALDQVCTRLVRDGEILVGWLVHLLATVAFWTTIVFPFLYLPLLLDGLQGRELLPLSWLLVVNVVVLFVGHEHAREASS